MRLRDAKRSAQDTERAATSEPAPGLSEPEAPPRLVWTRGGRGGPVGPHRDTVSGPGVRAESGPEHASWGRSRCSAPWFSPFRAPAPPGRSSLMGAWCPLVPRSRLVPHQAGRSRHHPGLRRGHLLLHGGLRSPRLDSSSELGGRCVGNAGPGMSVGGPEAQRRGPPAARSDQTGAAARRGHFAARAGGRVPAGGPWLRFLASRWLLTQRRLHHPHAAWASPGGPSCPREAR